MKLEFEVTKLVKIPNVFSGKLLEKLRRSLFAILLRQKDKLFQNSVDPDGKPWTPLSKRTAALKERKNRPDGEIEAINTARVSKGLKELSPHKILIASSALKNSLTEAGAPYQITSDRPFEIVLGTNLPYAKIQNDGGTINVGERTRLKDKKTLRAQNSTIPARPFIGFGKNDAKQVNEKIAAFIKKQGA